MNDIKKKSFGLRHGKFLFKILVLVGRREVQQTNTKKSGEMIEVE